MKSRIERLLDGQDSGNVYFISGYPNIFYYSGFTSEDAFLFIADDTRILVTDSRYIVQAKQQAPEFDIMDISEGWEKIFAAVHHMQIGFEENKMSVGSFERIRAHASGKDFFRAQNIIDAPRRYKDSEELKAIADAEKIGDEAFTHIFGYIRPGMTERDIALELEMYMKRSGATDLSFTTIAASGVRSAMPHGTASEKIVENGDILTLDFGCVYKGYCSDMTRTVVVGRADEMQRKIYDIVLGAQMAALDGMRAGMRCSEIDALARDYIAEAGYGDKFGHSLGHGVGIEIHESPNFSPKSKDVLEEGNVLSVEPGIYIEGFGGVRIEDLIAVKDGKIVNFTYSPKQLIEL